MNERFGKKKGLRALRRRRSSSSRSDCDSPVREDPCEVRQLLGHSEHADVCKQTNQHKRPKVKQPSFLCSGRVSGSDHDDAPFPDVPEEPSLFGKSSAGRSEDDKWHDAQPQIVNGFYSSFSDHSKHALLGVEAQVRAWLSSDEALSDNGVKLPGTCATCKPFSQIVKVIFQEVVVNVHFKWVYCARCFSCSYCM